MRQAKFFSCILLLALILPVWHDGQAASETEAGQPILFKETGHSLAYNFRSFWDTNGSLPILGYPLTEVFVENGRPVQYFERAKLEWHADKGLVQLGQLGRWAAQTRQNLPAFAPFIPPTADPGEYFGETGHTLQGSFQQFWHANGGLKIFGFPISQEFYETNPQDYQTYLVQYFERSRFELHPQNQPPYQILLGQLGRQFLENEHPAPSAALAAVTEATDAWAGLRPTRITIPRIKLDTEIEGGSFSLAGWVVPRYTAVHYWPIAGFPGTPGNIIIAGHGSYRNTIFYQLPQAQIGDEINVWMGKLERRYRVSVIWTVEPNATWVMSPSEEEVLTLITCVPLNVYDHRLIVRAVPVQTVVTGPTS